MLNVLATVDGLVVTHDTYQGQGVPELTLTTRVVPSSPEALRKLGLATNLIRNHLRRCNRG